jgi:hypothetical protein
MFLNEPYRFARKCSQCRQEGCNKGKATCPVNIERTGVVPVVVPVKKRRCGACRREGCRKTNPTCPVNVELCRHYARANRMEPEPNNADEYGNAFNHIENPVCRQRLAANLRFDIREIYYNQRVISNMRTLRIAEILRAAYSQADSNEQRSKVKLNVLPEYKMCSEECGICYDKTCNVTLNCNHQVCVDCFKGNVTATETKFNASLKCPFCRCVTETVNATDANIHDELVKL